MTCNLGAELGVKVLQQNEYKVQAFFNECYLSYLNKFLKQPNQMKSIACHCTLTKWGMS